MRKFREIMKERRLSLAHQGNGLHHKLTVSPIKYLSFNKGSTDPNLVQSRVELFKGLTTLDEDLIFKHAPTLQALDISYNNFSTLKCLQWFGRLFELISLYCVFAITIFHSHNEIPDSVGWIFWWIWKKDQLKELIVDSNQLTDECDYPYLQSLMHLSISNNQICDLERLMDKASLLKFQIKSIFRFLKKITILSTLTN